MNICQMDLREEIMMIKNIQSDIEKLKEKYLKNKSEPLWKCPIQLGLSDKELKNWNTDSDDNLWKIVINKYN